MLKKIVEKFDRREKYYARDLSKFLLSKDS